MTTPRNRPRRKGVSPLFPLHIPRNTPSEQLLASTIQGSILLQNYVRDEITARVDPDLLSDQGWMPHATTTDAASNATTERRLARVIQEFKMTQSYPDLVKLALNVSNGAMEKESMLRLMLMTFSDAGPSLDQQCSALFVFCAEVSVAVLNRDRNALRFQEYFSNCMHFLNDVVAEKVSSEGGWSDMLSSEEEHPNGTLAVRKEIWLASISFCIGALLLGTFYIVRTKA